MSMKNKLIAGNWKMNGSLEANDALVRALVAGMSQAQCQVAVCVPADHQADKNLANVTIFMSVVRILNQFVEYPLSILAADNLA